MPGTTHHRKGPFRSQKQWRWAWATHQKFAREWSEEIVAERGKKTGYRSLPGHSRTSTAKQRSRSNAIRKALTKRS